MKKGIDLIQYNPHSRRHFIKGSTGFCLTLPFLETIFQPSVAKAAPNGARRFIFLHNGHGQVPQYWFPTNDPAFMQKGAGAYNSAPLSGITGDISSTIGAEFNSLKSKMNLIRGIDFLGDGASNHSPEACLMSGKGQGGGLTADHVIAKYLSTAYGRQISSTVIHNGYDKESSSYGETGKVVGETNAQNFFASLFGVTPTVNPGSGPAPVPPAGNNSAVLQRNKKSVDVVIQQVNSLMKDPRLSAADKQAMEQHLQFLSEMEGKIFGVSTGGGAGGNNAVLPLSFSLLGTMFSISRDFPLLLYLTSDIWWLILRF